MSSQKQAKPGTVAFATFIGSAIEWYDFNIYGLAAALVFNRLFFPDFSASSGTLAALAAFAVGFIARPIGAVALGHFGDRVGRKAVLVVSLLTMGAATTAIGLLPTYATIGVWAPILLVVLRLLQGAGVGGEWGGAALLAVEHAPPGRRSLYGAFPQIGIPAGTVLSQIVFLVLTNLLSEQALASWGWRIPFLLSGVLIAVGLVVRLKIEETNDFRATKAKGDIARIPLLEVFRRSSGRLLAGSFLSIVGPMLGSFLAVYMINYGKQQLKLPTTTMLWILISICIPWMLFMLLSGQVSDRIGRKPMFVAGAALAALAAIPMFLLVDTAYIPLVVGGLLLMTVANGVVNGAQPALLAQMFPTGVRYSAISVCYQFGSIIGGGLLPLLATAAFTEFGTSLAIGLILAGASAVSLVAALTVPAQPVEKSSMTGGEEIAAPDRAAVAHKSEAH